MSLSFVHASLVEMTEGERKRPKKREEKMFAKIAFIVECKPSILTLILTWP